MTVWSFISPSPYWSTFGLCPVFLLLQTVQWISLYIYLCALVGEFFIGGLLLMSKHDRFRMLHVECSGDVISVLRRVQLSKHYLAHISLSLWSWPGTSAFTLTLPKGRGFWAEPARFPPPSANFIAKWNSIHWVRATLGFAFINEMTTLCWAFLGSGALWWVCRHSPEADGLVKEITNKEKNG